ncbi:cytochrome P450 [Qingshengfaniella alkalisoli]|uniref:Cytochrome P450 n=1 Tax=Qingshengfaniella alkalisoli TaxID=2599296 RepID=A0A5B8IWT7_9RHOB|nr:cytochrome P450 [Qingshengfaniella alkalisoli]QDY70144.1 cytochrome P450 [Qingshengfaniella alkalisoli]
MISSIMNLLRTAWRLILIWADAFRALWALRGAAVLAVRDRNRLAEKLIAPEPQRHVLAILRAWAPNISLKRQVVKAYENTGTSVVTRREDVLDVLSRDEDFEVVYGPRMRELTGGANFFLGMQPGWDYTRDTSAMRLAMRHSDVPRVVLPRAIELSEQIVASSEGMLDLPQALTLEVSWDIVARYFGLPGPDPEAIKNWATTLFWYLFGDLGADPELRQRSMDSAKGLRNYIDVEIAQRKSQPTEKDDVLARCLALQAAATPGMDDLGIRNNLLGLVIGAIPTISKASCLALDELLRRPEALASARKAIDAGDDQLFAGHIWEALRFNPHNPVIYRRATCDTQIARSSLREKQITNGQMVFVSTLSAMFDRLDIDSPLDFKPDRPFNTHIIWGKGMHSCFGAQVNQAVIPAILKPLIAKPSLRRAEDARGQISAGGTPFPQHFHIAY